MQDTAKQKRAHNTESFAAKKDKRENEKGLAPTIAPGKTRRQGEHQREKAETRNSEGKKI